MTRPPKPGQISSADFFNIEQFSIVPNTNGRNSDGSEIMRFFQAWGDYSIYVELKRKKDNVLFRYFDRPKIASSNGKKGVYSEMGPDGEYSEYFFTAD
jgi:hypothetical protein